MDIACIYQNTYFVSKLTTNTIDSQCKAPFVRDVDRKEGVAHPLFPTLESSMKNKYEGDEPEQVKVLEGKLA